MHGAPPSCVDKVHSFYYETFPLVLIALQGGYGLIAPKSAPVRVYSGMITRVNFLQNLENGEEKENENSIFSSERERARSVFLEISRDSRLLSMSGPPGHLQLQQGGHGNDDVDESSGKLNEVGHHKLHTPLEQKVKNFNFRNCKPVSWGCSPATDTSSCSHSSTSGTSHPTRRVLPRITSNRAKSIWRSMSTLVKDEKIEEAHKKSHLSNQPGWRPHPLAGQWLSSSL